MLVRPDHCAIDKVEIPVELARGIGPRLDGRQEPVPDAGLAPAVEAAGHRLPGAIPFGQITPRCPRAEQPQNTIEDAPMVDRRTSSRRFLGRKQRLSLFPLLVSQGMSVCTHTKMYTD
jgi:hypothetical protein